MKSQEAFAAFQDAVRSSKLDPSFSLPAVASITGPAVVIEAIVRTAEEKSGISMDWGYVAGRAYVYAKGDTAKARHALFLAVPTSDLSMEDL